MQNTNFPKPFMICIVGGTASGKSTFTNSLKKMIDTGLTHFGLDNFYIGAEEGIHPDDIDFDHPSSIDLELAVDCLIELSKTGETNIPIYDFKTHKRVKGKVENLKAHPIIVFEGTSSKSQIKIIIL